MTFTKRVRVIWAALTQDWHERRCECGQRFFVQTMPWAAGTAKCGACEEREMNEWIAAYEGRRKASVNA